MGHRSLQTRNSGMLLHIGFTRKQLGVSSFCYLISSTMNLGRKLLSLAFLWFQPSHSTATISIWEPSVMVQSHFSIWISFLQSEFATRRAKLVRLNLIFLQMVVIGLLYNLIKSILLQCYAIQLLGEVVTHFLLIQLITGSMHHLWTKWAFGSNWTSMVL